MLDASIELRTRVTPLPTVTIPALGGGGVGGGVRKGGGVGGGGGLLLAIVVNEILRG
jgi:hypothetical protein